MNDDLGYPPLSCANCAYSSPTMSDDPDEGPLLKCARYPQVIFVVDGIVTQAFPDATETCGEHSELA